MTSGSQTQTDQRDLEIVEAFEVVRHNCEYLAPDRTCAHPRNHTPECTPWACPVCKTADDGVNPPVVQVPSEMYSCIVDYMRPKLYQNAGRKLTPGGLRSLAG